MDNALKLDLLIPVEQNIYYKNNPAYFLELKELVESMRYGLVSKLTSKKRHLVSWMFEMLPKLQSTSYSLATRIYWILNGLTDFPICQHCHTSEHRVGKNVVSMRSGYTEFCSNTCVQNSKQIQAKKLNTLHSTTKPCNHALRSKKTSTTIHSTKCRKYAFKELHLLCKLEDNIYYSRNPAYVITLKTIIENNPRGYRAILMSTKYMYLVDWINSQVVLLQNKNYNISTKCYWILNGLTDFPVCANESCSNKLDHHLPKRMMNVNVFTGYANHYCSRSCACTSEQTQMKSAETKIANGHSPTWTNRDKARATMKLKYGVEQYNNIEKTKQTKLARYGNPYWTNSEKKKQTDSLKTDDEWHAIYNKACDTYYKATGFHCPSQNPQIMSHIVDKIRATSQERYHTSWPSQSPIIKDQVETTCIEKYGAKTYMQTSQFREQSEQTCLRKYGTKTYTQSDEFKNKFLDEDFKDHWLTAQHNTKRRNGTFNTSAPENRIYDALVLKFGSDDVIRQHKDQDRYPFRCDFYVKSLDLFIEFNGTWTHGEHPYDPNNEEDRLKVEKLLDLAKTRKQKTGKKSMYETAIEVWTQKDPEKYEAAAKHGLHYLVFWTEDEAMSWISDLPAENLRTIE